MTYGELVFGLLLGISIILVLNWLMDNGGKLFLTEKKEVDKQ